MAVRFRQNIFGVSAYNFIPVFAPEAEFSRALGASASVLAITVAIAVIVPDYAIMLIILGKVKLKYIALISIVLDLISLRSGNAGGHIAHLGGAAFGLVFAMQHLAGRDITKGISKVLSGIPITIDSKNNIRPILMQFWKRLRNRATKAFQKKKKNCFLEKVNEIKNCCNYLYLFCLYLN